MVLFRQGLDKKLLLYIGLPSALFVILGGLLSKYLQGYWLEILLGVFLVAMSLIFLLKKDLIIPPNKKNATLGGVLSGFTAGLLGTGGAIRGLTMAAFNLEKSVFIATSAAIDMMIDLTRTVVYYKNGFIHQHDMVYVPFLFVIGLVGSYLGKQLLAYIPQVKFRMISLILILLIGLISIGKQFLT
jgi:uncharacterized membrane protein YfcA